VNALSFRDKFAAIAYRFGIVALITALAFGLIYRWDERTPCPTYTWSTLAAFVIGTGFLANLVTFRKRGILMAMILAAATWISAPSFTRNRQSRNESKALATMEAILSAEDALFASAGRRGSIPDLVANGLLPRCVANVAWGYWYEARVQDEGLTIIASPETIDSGRWIFSKGPDRITRYSPEEALAPAGLANAPVR
jgi:hypothetical protein